MVLRQQRPEKTSRTSSKPPSMDRKAQREKSRPGGAKLGHDCHSRRLSEDFKTRDAHQILRDYWIISAQAGDPEVNPLGARGRLCDDRGRCHARPGSHRGADAIADGGFARGAGRRRTQSADSPETSADPCGPAGVHRTARCRKLMTRVRIHPLDRAPRSCEPDFSTLTGRADGE